MHYYFVALLVGVGQLLQAVARVVDVGEPVRAAHVDRRHVHGHYDQVPLAHDAPNGRYPALDVVDLDMDGCGAGEALSERLRDIHGMRTTLLK